MADLRLPLKTITYAHATAIQDSAGTVIGELCCDNHGALAASLVALANAGRLKPGKVAMRVNAMTIGELAEAEAAIMRGLAPLIQAGGVAFARVAVANLIDRLEVTTS